MDKNQTQINNASLTNLQTIEHNLSCCGQIDGHHIATIKELGFKTLICARPDHEEIAQPLSDHIQKTAEEHGITYINVPFRSSLNEVEQCQEFCRVAEEHKQLHPTLAFCRTGSRVLMAWYTYKQHALHD